MAFGGDVTAGPAFDSRESDPVVLGRLMHPSGFKVIDHHLGEIVEEYLHSLALALSGVNRVNQFVFIRGNDSMWGKAFH